MYGDELARMERKHKQITEFAVSDILELCRNRDLTPLDTVLVLNGGTGVGKTTAIMQQVKPVLEVQFARALSMLVVESRTATKQQLEHEYAHLENGIDVCQRQGFGRAIDSGEGLDYDFIVIDECHGLFSEATFADDAGRIARWIEEERKNQHIIFITANDTFFNDLAKQYFTNLNYIYLFPDFSEYVSNTFVKEIQWIRTRDIDKVYQVNYGRFRKGKGIIFVKSAREANALYSEMLERGFRAGLVVSLANETKVQMAEVGYIREKAIVQELSDMKAGFTLADACEMIDRIRAAEGKEKIRDALIAKRVPEDIDVLIATDTIQEGISIESHIDYIFIEGFTEEEIEQKAGRYRGCLNLLYIIFCPQKVQKRLAMQLAIFKDLEVMTQLRRGMFYGKQEMGQFPMKYLVCKTKPGIDTEGMTREELLATDNLIFEINEPARLKLQRDISTYTALLSDAAAPYRLYGHKTRNPETDVKILDFQEDIKGVLIEEGVGELVEKWKGKPLKGPLQEDFIEDFAGLGIRRSDDNKPGFTKCLLAIQENGYEIIEKRASRADCAEYPFLSSREKYKMIIGPQN